jgi:DNA polymerase III subunit beta
MGNFMKFKVSIAEFQKLLQKTLPAIPPKSTLPILEHLHFTIFGNKLKIIATDQDITIISSIDVVVEQEGKILVPARRISEIVKALGLVGDLEFYADLETFEIKITTKNGVYQMKGLNPDEYLDIPELFESKKPEIDKETFGDAPSDETSLKTIFEKDVLISLATKTVFAVSNDEFRPAMTGVLFQFRENVLNAVATDSYRLVRIIHRTEKPIYPKEMDIIIPARSVELLKKVDNEVIMSVIETHGKITHARFDYGDTIFITRIIDEKFPPYESVIPKNNELAAVIDQRELLSAIKRISILTSSISKQIVLYIQHDQLTIIGRDEEYGTEGDETLPCSFNGDKLDIAFNYRFLEEALQNIDVSQENNYQIVMTFSEPKRPALIKPQGESEDVLMLIMPVRL